MECVSSLNINFHYLWYNWLFFFFIPWHSQYCQPQKIYETCISRFMYIWTKYTRKILLHSLETTPGNINMNLLIPFGTKEILPNALQNMQWHSDTDIGYGFLMQRSRAQNHWVASSSTQSFILPRSIKRVSGAPAYLVVKINCLHKEGQ